MYRAYNMTHFELITYEYMPMNAYNMTHFELTTYECMWFDMLWTDNL